MASHLPSIRVEGLPNTPNTSAEINSHINGSIGTKNCLCSSQRRSNMPMLCRIKSATLDLHHRRRQRAVKKLLSTPPPNWSFYKTLISPSPTNVDLNLMSQKQVHSIEFLTLQRIIGKLNCKWLVLDCNIIINVPIIL